MIQWFVNNLDLIKSLVIIFGFPLTLVASILAYKQYRRVITWNKINAMFSLFGNKAYTEHQISMANELKRLGIEIHKKYDALTPSECDAIVADLDAYSSVKYFLNFLEDFATALHCGLIHEEISFNIMGGVLVKYYKIFSPLIKKRRMETMYEHLWIQLECAQLKFEREFSDMEMKKIIDEKNRLNKIIQQNLYNK